MDKIESLKFPFYQILGQKFYFLLTGQDKCGHTIRKSTTKTRRTCTSMETKNQVKKSDKKDKKDQQQKNSEF